MKPFEVYCKRCQKFDADCIMCCATSSACANRFTSATSHEDWVWNDERPTLYFGPKHPRRFAELGKEDQDEILIKYLMARAI